MLASKEIEISVSITKVTAPVRPHGEKVHVGGEEFVGEILEPVPVQNQPNTIRGWRLGSV